MSTKECERPPVEAFPVLGQPSEWAEPGEGALAYPAPGQEDVCFGLIRPLDDLRCDAGEGSLDRALELRSQKRRGAAHRENCGAGLILHLLSGRLRR